MGVLAGNKPLSPEIPADAARHLFLIVNESQEYITCSLKTSNRSQLIMEPDTVILPPSVTMKLTCEFFSVFRFALWSCEFFFVFHVPCGVARVPILMNTPSMQWV